MSIWRYVPDTQQCPGGTILLCRCHHVSFSSGELLYLSVELTQKQSLLLQQRQTLHIFVTLDCSLPSITRIMTGIYKLSINTHGHLSSFVAWCGKILPLLCDLFGRYSLKISTLTVTFTLSTAIQNCHTTL